MEISDLLEVVSQHKAEWRSVLEENGEQCVMTCGVLLMPKWSADNWDMRQLVRHEQPNKAKDILLHYNSHLQGLLHKPMLPMVRELDQLY